MKASVKEKITPITNERDLRASPNFNPWLGSDVTSANFQRMTRLPEDLERALLDVPMGALLIKCGILGASSKYTCVQKLAIKMTEEQLRKFVSLDHPEDPPRPERFERPEPRALMAQAEGAHAVAMKAEPQRRMPGAVSQGFMRGDTKVTLLTGKTAIQVGSLRDKVIVFLRSMGAITIQDLQEAMKSNGQNFDVRPVLGKLRAAGWVELTLASQTGDQK